MTIRLDIHSIEKRRMALGLTRKELARRSGITPGRYSQIVSEAKAGKEPFAPTVKEIVRVLGLEMEDLLISSEQEEVA